MLPALVDNSTRHWPTQT